MEASQPQGEQQATLAIVSLVLGILGLLTSCVPICGFTFSVIGLILAIVAKDQTPEDKDNLRRIGLILSAIGIGLSLILCIVGAVLGVFQDVIEGMDLSMMALRMLA